jgi:uncharacterized C2H2 Zn-finger protein
MATKPRGKLKCPECGRTDFKKAGALASHRRYAHGVIGEFRDPRRDKSTREYEQLISELRAKNRELESTNKHLRQTLEMLGDAIAKVE